MAKTKTDIETENSLDIDDALLASPDEDGDDPIVPA